MESDHNIEFMTGDMFAVDADIRINTVNCVGVMGAGVALEFKKRYPDMFAQYVGLCKKKLVQPGVPYVWSDNSILDDSAKDIIIKLPTKNHWRRPSEYSYIENGLRWMSENLEAYNGKTLVMPALGCGHGGLDWSRVRQMIIDHLSNLDLKIKVFEPSSSNMTQGLSQEDINFMQRKNIRTISPSDASYPDFLRGKSAINLYYHGNIDRLNNRRSLALLPCNNGEEDIDDRVAGCIAYYSQSDISFLLGLESDMDMKILETCLSNHIDVILILPYGIREMRLSDRVKSLWNNDMITVVSLCPPSTKYSPALHNKADRLRIAVSGAVLADKALADRLKTYKLKTSSKPVYFY